MLQQIRREIVNAARATDIETLAQSIAVALLRPGVVLARVWVAEGGDFRLAGSAGVPTGGGTYTRLDGQFGRITAGQGKIALIAATRAPFVVRSIRGDEDWLTNPGWTARQGVRAFLGYPLTANDDVVGVLAVFDRVAPTDQTLEDVAFLADYAAARIDDLRERDALHAQHVDLAARPAAPPIAVHPAAAVTNAPTIVTRAELRQMEKRMIENALARTSGRVFGPCGAAAVLAMKPTTLASRIKALGIRSMR